MVHKNTYLLRALKATRAATVNKMNAISSGVKAHAVSAIKLQNMFPVITPKARHSKLNVCFVHDFFCSHFNLDGDEVRRPLHLLC